MQSKTLILLVITAIIAAAIGAAATYVATTPPQQAATTITQTKTVTVSVTVTETAPAPPPSEPRVLRVSHWGFAWDDIKAIVIEPFEKKFNVKIELISGRSSERMAKVLEGAEPKPDLIFLSDYFMHQLAAKGLLERLDFSKIPNYKKLYPFIRQTLEKTEVGKYGVPFTIQDMLLIYRKDLHDPVKSFKDMWREDFKGFVLLPAITATTGPLTLAMASIAHGGTIENVEPGFKALEKLKDGVVTFYVRSADLSSLFERGEAHIAPGLRYQLGAVQKVNATIGGGITYVIPEEGSIFVLNLISIHRDSQNKDLAYELINFWLSTEIQQKLAEAGVDPPVNAEVSLPAGHFFDTKPITRRPIYIDPAFLVQNRQAWIEEWKSRVGG